jgi:hypothetical protein
VTTDGAGNATFSTTLTTSVATGAIITATATDSAGNTSEFSESDVTATASNQVLVVTTTSFVEDGNVTNIDTLIADPGADGKISFSEAVRAANATTNIGLPDLITFNIPLDDAGHLYYQDDGVAGFNSVVATTLDDASISDFDVDLPGTPHSWYRITFTEAIDSGDISDAVHIDATTQPGFSGDPIIELDFSDPGAEFIDGLRLAGGTGGSTIRGFIFNGLQNEDPIKVDTPNNKIVGNWFGLDSTGTKVIGNFDNAIHLSGGSDNTIIGGPTEADRNVIAGSGFESIKISTTGGHIIQGNYIGTDKTGLVDLGGGSHGIRFYNGASNSIIEGNIIGEHASGSGIIVDDAVSSGITITGNTIRADGQLGIDILAAGGNDSQSAPTLLSAVSDGITTTVTGTLTSTANETFTLEFFSSDSSSAGDEGQVYLGSILVTTDGLGPEDFTAVLSVGVVQNAKITATATNAGGSTSEFSTEFPATGPAIDNAPVAFDETYNVAQDTTLTVDWWDTTWTKRQQLTFDNLRQTEDLTDFPVLVKLTGGFNIDYSQTQDNGEDLRFFDADGTALAYDIEEWNEGGTSYVWVRVPQIDGWSNTDYITMYYGNASAPPGEDSDRVWLSGYAMVHHLEETSGTNFDSTANDNDGIHSGAGQDFSGWISGGNRFNGSGDKIEVRGGDARVRDHRTWTDAWQLVSRCLDLRRSDEHSAALRERRTGGGVLYRHRSFDEYDRSDCDWLQHRFGALQRRSRRGPNVTRGAVRGLDGRPVRVDDGRLHKLQW